MIWAQYITCYSKTSWVVACWFYIDNQLYGFSELNYNLRRFSSGSCMCVPFIQSMRYKPQTVFLPLNSLGRTSSLRWVLITLGDGKTSLVLVIGTASIIANSLASLIYSIEPLCNMVIISHIKWVPKKTITSSVTFCEINFLLLTLANRRFMLVWFTF